MKLHPGLDAHDVAERLQSAGLWIDPETGAVTIDVEGDPSITIKEYSRFLAPGSWMAYWDDDQCCGWVLIVTADPSSSTGQCVLIASIPDMLALAVKWHARSRSQALLLGHVFSEN